MSASARALHLARLGRSILSSEGAIKDLAVQAQASQIAETMNGVSSVWRWITCGLRGAQRCTLVAPEVQCLICPLDKEMW